MMRVNIFFAFVLCRSIQYSFSKIQLLHNFLGIIVKFLEDLIGLFSEGAHFLIFRNEKKMRLHKELLRINKTETKI